MRFEPFAGILSIAAAAAHAVLTPERFAQGWAYGAFSIIVVSGQTLLGIAILRDAFHRHFYRWLVAMGGVTGHSLVASLYLFSRSFGLPLFGPAPSASPTLDTIALLAVGAELVAVAVLARSLFRARSRGPVDGGGR